MSPATATSFEHAQFIDPSAIDYLQVIPGPPALHSAGSNQDYQILETLQKERTEAGCTRARGEVVFDHFLTFFQVPHGPLSEKQVQNLKPFFDEVLFESKAVWKRAKDHWKRPRPYLVDLKLHPCVALENSFAYPSGHAATGELFALILSDLLPDQKSILLARGKEIGQDRLLGGVHHPSDVRDGRLLADRVYEEFYKNKNFVSALNEIKKATQE